MNPIASFARRLLLTLLLGGVSHASAADIYVIAHPGIQLSAEAIRDIFIGEKQFSGPVKITPFDNAAAQADFLEKVLKLDQTRYANLWVKKSFRDGLNPPSVKNGDREIIELVSKTPGAVGYVTSSPPAGVTVVRKY